MTTEFEKLTGIKIGNKSNIEVMRELVSYLEGINESKHKEILNAFYEVYDIDLDYEIDQTEVSLEEVKDIMIDEGAEILNYDNINGIIDAYTIIPEDAVIILSQFTEENGIREIVYDFGQIHDLHEILNQYKKQL